MPRSHDSPRTEAYAPARGRLPFVGRASELATLVAFLGDGDDSDELRAVRVSGEAGIGKSRLIEELLDVVRNDASVVLHVRVYPESTFSVFHAIASALMSEPTARSLLSGELPGELSAVAAALRRVARLRATHVIVEDTHALDARSSRHLGLLLATVRDERIGMVVVTRPNGSTTASPLSEYLVRDITLRGLARNELVDLWRMTFGSVPSVDVLDVLTEDLGGNPLAVRSALRCMLRAMDLDATPGARASLACTDELHRHLRAGAGRAIDGYVSHLDPDDRHAAERVACLGDVFAVETAEAIVGEEALGRLLDCGIVDAIHHSPLPLARRELSYTPEDFPAGACAPLGFTHSLVHRHLLATAHVDAPRLVTILASDLPLYSTLPFQLVTSHLPGACANRVLGDACTRSLQVAVTASQGGTAEERTDNLRAHQRFISAFEAGATPGQSRRLRCDMLVAELCFLDYTNHPDIDSMLPVAEELLALARRQSGADAAEMVLLALTWKCNLVQICRDRYPEKELAAIAELVRSRPELVMLQRYWLFLKRHVMIMRHRGDSHFAEGLRDAEAVLARIVASDAPEGIKERARISIVPVLVESFGSEDEARRRLDEIETLLASSGLNDMFRLALNSNYGALLFNLGYIEESRRVERTVSRTLREFGMQRQRAWEEAVDLCARGLMGVSLDVVEARTHAIIAGMPEDSTARTFRGVDVALIEVAILCGSRAHARRVFDRSRHDAHFRRRIDLPSLVGIASDRDDLISLVREQVDGQPELDTGDALVSWALGREHGGPDALAGELSALLDERVPAISYVRQMHSAIVVAEMCAATAGYEGVGEAVRSHGRAAVLHWLGWAADPRRSILTIVAMLLERHGHLLEPRESAEWTERLHALREEFARRSPARETDRRLLVSMLGTISVAEPDGTPARVRGARAQALLGTLVADLMLDRPFELLEFWQLVAGADDPDKARNVTNTTIHRLRSVLGHGAIVTAAGGTGGAQGAPPRLDLAVLEIDVIEVRRYVAESLEAVRRGAIARAVDAIRRALEIAGGEVPFPGLFDDFFEAVRTDFELHIREAVIEVTRAQLRERDASGAEAILRLANASMPGDEEIAGLLASALTLMGCRSEAVRVVRSA